MSRGAPQNKNVLALNKRPFVFVRAADMIVGPRDARTIVISLFFLHFARVGIRIFGILFSFPYFIFGSIVEASAT